jgi:hypothetical protein
LTAAIAFCTATQALPTVASARLSCAALKGKRLLTTSAIKVVERDVEGRRANVYLCVPPAGRVHLAGYAYDETGISQFEVQVKRSAGHWVVLRFRNQLDPQVSEEVEKTCDARSGRCYRFYSAGIGEGPAFEPPQESQEPNLDAFALNRFGQMIVCLSLHGRRAVVGIEADGRRRTLDKAPEAQIPPASLRLHGHVAEWSDAGVSRHTTL